MYVTAYVSYKFILISDLPEVYRTVVQRAKAETLEGTEYWAANKGSCINCQPLSEYFKPAPIAYASCSLDNCSEKHNIFM